MAKIDISALEHHPNGLELTHKVLCNLDETLTTRKGLNTLNAILNTLDGSNIKAFLSSIGGGGSTIFVDLRCGNHHSCKLDPDEVSKEVIKLLPFIAACAGPIEEKAEPGRLERLEERVARLEKLTGITEE